MSTSFSEKLSQLRHEKGVSQRIASSELGISQALLSHYENGLREPGLEFVVRACEYYDVSADYILGRCDEQGGFSRGPDQAQLLELMHLVTDMLADSAAREEDAAAIAALYPAAAEIVEKKSPLRARRA